MKIKTINKLSEFNVIISMTSDLQIFCNQELVYIYVIAHFINFD